MASAVIFFFSHRNEINNIMKISRAKITQSRKEAQVFVYCFSCCLGLETGSCSAPRLNLNPQISSLGLPSAEIAAVSHDAWLLSFQEGLGLEDQSKYSELSAFYHSLNK